MKLRRVKIHNFRSIRDVDLEVNDYTILVGANNAGKSNFLNALRIFYDDIKWSSADIPRFAEIDGESWIELLFALEDSEWDSLADKYKDGLTEKILRVRRFFRSDDKERVKANQSNIYGYVRGALDGELFYGAKNIASAKIGQIIFVPALTTVDEQTKLSGPSPLREVLNFLIKKIVSHSPAYSALAESFHKLNKEARGEQGFLREVADPLNSAISDWNIKIDFSVNPVKPEDISKNLVSFSFLDVALGDVGFELARYGHGFQRSVIYELIRLAPTFRDSKAPSKKGFNPDLTLILFEEPEAFLHPAQQENMAFHLRRLAQEPTQQVMLCTHSIIFAGKASENIGQIARFRRESGITQIYQVDAAALKGLFSEGGRLLNALQVFVNDPAVGEEKKKKARKFISNPPQAQIAEDEERFRFQLWLDGERASLFFADRVLLVEGATERALFSYLLAGEWHDLCQYRICVIDVLGKFNLHRFMSLLNAFGIPYGIILDDDNDLEHHQVINDLVFRTSNLPSSTILAPPERIISCLEELLGIPRIENRSDKKPIEAMKAITNGTVDAMSVRTLRETFKRALALP